MALYSEDFASKTLGAVPSGWTPRWNTADTTWAVTEGGLVGGRFVRMTSSTTDRRLLSWDAIDADANRADVELLVLWRSSRNTSFQLYLNARASGEAGNETAYSAILQGGADLQLYRFLNGASSQINSAVYSWAADTWYWTRFRVNGTSLQAKIWEEHEPEPVDWTVEGTDSQISDPGWVGPGGNYVLGDKDYDTLLVGTNGDSPAALSNTGPIRVSQSPLEVLSQPASPTGRLSQVVLEVLWREPLPPPAGGGAGEEWGPLWRPKGSLLWRSMKGEN